MKKKGKQSINKEGIPFVSIKLRKVNSKYGGVLYQNTQVSPSSKIVKKQKIKHTYQIQEDDYIASKMNSLNINDEKDLILKKIQLWNKNPNIHPVTKSELKINFIDEKSDYAILYKETFIFFYNLVSKKDINYIIKYIKKKLPTLHYINIVIQESKYIFDYLFYQNLIQIHDKNDVMINLKFSKLYELISTNDIIVLEDFNFDNATSSINEYFNLFIKTFVYLIFSTIYDVVEEKKLVSKSIINELFLYKKDLDDIAILNKNFNQDVKKYIYEYFIRRSINENFVTIDELFYSEFISNNYDMQDFLYKCFEDIEEISLITHIDQNKGKIMKLKDPYMIEEPIPPYLKPLPQITPEKPNLEKINSLFQDESEESRQKIYERKMKIYEDMIRDIQTYSSRLKKFNSEHANYLILKKKYDDHIRSIMNLSVKNAKRNELLNKLIGDDIPETEKCKLGPNEDLLSPFTTNYDPLKSYPLYQLETIVKIHVKDGEKIIRTDCGNAIDLYNYIIDFYNEGEKPKHPMLQIQLSDENIEEIFKKVPYIVKDFKEPDINLINMLGNKLDLYFDMIESPETKKYGINFYYNVYLTRKFGSNIQNGFVDDTGYKTIVYHICTFPTKDESIINGVSTESTTYGMIELLNKLFVKKRLLHNYNPPYCIISNNTDTFTYSYIAIGAKLMKMRSITDWIYKNKTIRKESEISQLFDEIYEDLSYY